MQNDTYTYPPASPADIQPEPASSYSMLATDPAPADVAPAEPVATSEPPSPEPEPEPESVYTRAEILEAADSYGTTAGHLAAALHLLGRPDAATRKDVEKALKRLDKESA